MQAGASFFPPPSSKAPPRSGGAKIRASGRGATDGPAPGGAVA